MFVTMLAHFEIKLPNLTILAPVCPYFLINLSKTLTGNLLKEDSTTGILLANFQKGSEQLFNKKTGIAASDICMKNHSHK